MVWKPRTTTLTRPSGRTDARRGSCATSATPVCRCACVVPAGGGDGRWQTSQGFPRPAHRIAPTTSIGIATSTSTSTPDSLLREADSARHRAKAAGRACWHFFDDAMHAQAVARLTVEDQLRDAITRAEFVVFYQPIVALADAHVVGHEALVRWAHPTRGLLSPADFLNVAEGVETQRQADILRGQGWECGQGHYFGRPAAIPVTDCYTDGDLIA